MKKFNFILLIDDDPIANYLTERLIRSLQITEKILIAQNGEQALTVINEECSKGNPSPDLILLDINMPVMDGLEFLQIFSYRKYKDNEKTNIAVLTTSTHHKDYSEILSYGVNNILHKPLTEKKLKEVWENTENF